MERYKLIDNNLRLLKEVQQEVASSVERLLETAKALKKKSEDTKTLLPYNINIIDELYINENGHSRILMKLLQCCNSKGEYEILQSFVDYVSNMKLLDNFDIKIVKPILTQEIERIDLWVRDRDYALIFENKIYNAADQDAQLYRYIEKTKNQGFQSEQIYVFYLPQFQHGPDVRTWGNNGTKEQFKSRFAILSFRDYILPWLKGNVLPNVRQKDHLLLSAIVQYIDYLEGLFNIRLIDNNYNMELQDIITEQLGLKGIDLNERLQLLDKNLSDLNDLQRQMQQMRNRACDELFKQYTEKWFQEFEAPEHFVKCRYPNDEFAVKFSCDGRETFIYIGNDGQLYCQIEYDRRLKNEERQLGNCSWLAMVEQFLPRRAWYCRWKYLDDFDSVYQCFKQVVTELAKQLDGR